jgi:hypothetical protein
MSEKPMLEKFAFSGSSAWRVVEREGSLQPRRPHRHFKFAEQTAAAASWYEYLTAFRDEKRATLSLLLRTPQDPTEDVSMTVSLRLVLYFNTLHGLLHVEGLEGHQRHHCSWYVLYKISECGDDPWGQWITTYIAPKCTAAATDLFFIH